MSNSGGIGAVYNGSYEDVIDPYSKKLLYSCGICGASNWSVDSDFRVEGGLTVGCGALINCGMSVE